MSCIRLARSSRPTIVLSLFDTSAFMTFHRLGPPPSAERANLRSTRSVRARFGGVSHALKKRRTRRSAESASRAPTSGPRKVPAALTTPQSQINPPRGGTARLGSTAAASAVALTHQGLPRKRVDVATYAAPWAVRSRPCARIIMACLLAERYLLSTV